jgi:CRISPR-associated protein Cmr3
VGLSEELVPKYLDERGTIKLGGEQRTVRYEMAQIGPPETESQNDWVMSLNAVPFSTLKDYGFEAHARASGPLIRMAGWDMKEGFHKPVTAYMPAGTVIRAGESSTTPFGFIRI